MKMAHITINTARLDDSIQFYQTVLGLDVVSDFRKRGGMPIVFLRNASDEVSIELIENADQPYSGTGISIGFHVDDVQTVRERAERDGLHPSPMVSPKPGVMFFFLEDPNGVKIQLT